MAMIFDWRIGFSRATDNRKFLAVQHCGTRVYLRFETRAVIVVTTNSNVDEAFRAFIACEAQQCLYLLPVAAA